MSTPKYDYDAQAVAKLDDKRALIRVMSDYEQAVSEKGDDLIRGQRYLNIYQALDPPDERIDETTGLIEDDEAMYSNTYMAIGAAVVDSATAQLFNLFFSTDDFFKIGADDFEDGFFAIEITGHLKKRMKEMRFRNTIYRAIQQACTFDYSVTMTRWLLEGGYQPQPQRETETVSFGNLKFKKQTVKSKPVYLPDKVDRSDVMLLNYMRCYPDWTSLNCLKDSRFFCDDRDETIENLVMNSDIAKPWGKYKNIKKVVKTAMLDMKSDFEEIDNPDIRREFVNARRIKVIRYMTRDHLIEVAEGHIIRRMNLYDWPIQIWRCFEVPNQFNGMGFLQRLERNQLDINASLNSRRNFQLASNPFAVIDKELLGEHGGSPKIYPGWVGVSKGGNVKDKVWVYTPGSNTTQDGMVDVVAQTNMVEKQSGINEQAGMGASSGSRKTATEVNTAASGQMTRLATTARRFEEENLEVIYLNLFFLEQTMLSKREMFRYHGEDADLMRVIDPAHYMWNSVPRFMAMGTLSVVVDAIKTQQFMAMVDRAAMMPQVPHDWNAIATEMWRRTVPDRYKDFIKDPTVPEHNVDPEDENALMAMGRVVHVSPLNDTNQHLQSHQGLKLSPDYQVWDERRKANLEIHIQEHQAGGAVGQRSNSLGQGQTGLGQGPADLMRGMSPPGLGATQ